jgi:hypothetical protein
LIKIPRSPTADSRSCDPSKVSKKQLLESSKQHITDVMCGLDFFRAKLMEAAQNHDPDKITDIDGFYADFKTGFKTQEWYERHKRLNRHHLCDEGGCPEDVNLVDVLDMIVDCVMAGKARSGSVYPFKLPPDLLGKAFNNTVELLKANVEVVE